MNSSRNSLRAGLLGAMFAGAVLLPLMWNREVDLNRQIGLERDAKEAGADTTRRLVFALNTLATGVQGVQRRLVQEEIRADKLDRALELRTVSMGTVKLQAAPVEITAKAESTKKETGDVIVLDFKDAHDSAHTVTVNANIVVPQPPQRAVATFHVLMDPIALEFRLGCGPKNRANNGVRPAQLSIFGPEYLRISAADLKQEPAVCNSKKENWMTDWRTIGLTGLLLIVGLRH